MNSWPKKIIQTAWVLKVFDISRVLNTFFLFIKNVYSIDLLVAKLAAMPHCYTIIEMLIISPIKTGERWAFVLKHIPSLFTRACKLHFPLFILCVRITNDAVENELNVISSLFFLALVCSFTDNVQAINCLSLYYCVRAIFILTASLLSHNMILYCTYTCSTRKWVNWNRHFKQFEFKRTKLSSLLQFNTFHLSIVFSTDNMDT